MVISRVRVNITTGKYQEFQLIGSIMFGVIDLVDSSFEKSLVLDSANNGVDA